MKTKLFLLAALIITISAVAQTEKKTSPQPRKIYIGLDGGIASYKTKVSNSFFPDDKLLTLGPSGINISFEIFKNWYTELGIYEQFVPSGYTKNGDLDDNWYFDEGASAQSLSFKLKKHFHLTEKFILSPFIGTNKVNISYFGSKGGRGASTYQEIENSQVIFEYKVKDVYIDYNHLPGYIIGSEILYKITPRLSLCFNISYFTNFDDTHLQQTLYYKKIQQTGSILEEGVIDFGTSGTYFQLGVKWRLADILKPGSYTLN